MFRCMGCMNEFEENHLRCPYCGYDKNEVPTNSYHLLPETILQGRYIVGRVLGVGGFGITYIGYDAELERVVAIKEFLPSMFATRSSGEMVVSVYQGEATNQYTQGLKRFVDEARTLAQFNGIPGIVDIYDSFTCNNTAYIMMQYLKGTDVKQILKTKGTLSYQEASEMVLAICDTLEQVHQKGIIHRDISPDNIYVTESGEIKLLDFGAARYESAMNSKSLSVILKKGYAPEEQYRSRGEQGGWTDVYALAATFYKMLTGITPQDSMERSMQDDLRWPSDLGVELPPNAEVAIIKALGVRKQNRTQSMAEFKQDLMDVNLELPEDFLAISTEKEPQKKNKAPMVVAIIASLVILMSVIAMISTGQSGESQVIDTFNFSSSSGGGEAETVKEQVAVPNVEGMTYEVAKATLEEAGFGIEVFSWYYGVPREDSGLILSQVQEANSLEWTGEEISVILKMGNPYDGVEIGLYPDFNEMNLGEVLELLDYSLNWYHIGYYITYEYSSEEDKGKVLDIVYYDKGENEYTEIEDAYVITIGLGPEETGDNPYGTLAFATMCDIGELHSLMDIREVGYVTYYVTSIDGQENPCDVITEFLVSADEGNTWDTIYSRKLSSYPKEYAEVTSFGQGYIELLNVPDLYQEQYEDQTLQFQIQRYAVENGEKVWIDSIDVDSTLTFKYEDSVEVTEVEIIETEEFTGWKIQGYFESYDAYELIEVPEGTVDGYAQELEFDGDVDLGSVYIPATVEEMQQYGGKEFILKEEFNSQYVYSLDDELGTYVTCEPARITLPVY